MGGYGWWLNFPKSWHLFSAALTALLLFSSVSATIKDHCTDISYWDVIKYESTSKLGFVKVTLSQDGKVVDRLTTDQTAKGQFNSPHGQVVLTAELDGFVMAPVLLRVASNECEKMIKLSLSPEYTGAARVV